MEFKKNKTTTLTFRLEDELSEELTKIAKKEKNKNVVQIEDHK